MTMFDFKTMAEAEHFLEKQGFIHPVHAEPHIVVYRSENGQKALIEDVEGIKAIVDIFPPSSATRSLAA